MAHLPRHRLAGGRDGARGLLGRPVWSGRLRGLRPRVQRGDLAWSHVPAGQAELVEGVLLALEAECRAFHLDYPTDQALEQLAWLAVAGRRFTGYVEVASRLGTDHWREVEALATSALRSKRRDLAVEVFRGADRPGWHQKLLRERCASLTGVVLGDPDGARPSLGVVGGSAGGRAQR